MPGYSDSAIRSLVGGGYVPAVFEHQRPGNQRRWYFTEESVKTLRDMKPHLDSGLNPREAYEAVLRRRWSERLHCARTFLAELMDTSLEMLHRYPATFQELDDADSVLPNPSPTTLRRYLLRQLEVP